MSEASACVRAPLAWLGQGLVVRDAAVVWEGDVITYAGPALGAPPAAEEIELDGFLMPAIADRHVHIGFLDPGALLAGGVTAVRDMGWPADEIFPLADASEMPSFNGPLVRAAGPILTASGGYPLRTAWAPEGAGRAVDDPQQAVEAVRHLAGSGAAHIKVALDATAGPTLTDGVLTAIVQTATESGLAVSAHVQGSGQVERALGAGVSELAHTPWTELLGESIVASLARSMRIVSTLDVHSYGNDTPEIRTALDNLRRFAAAGGRVLYGTDLGGDNIPPGISVRELMLMREAGISTEETILAAVRAPLEVGAPADMIGVAENPFEALDSLADLLLVVRAGRIAAASDA